MNKLLCEVHSNLVNINANIAMQNDIISDLENDYFYKKILELKSNAIKNQKFELSAIYRDIERSLLNLDSINFSLENLEKYYEKCGRFEEYNFIKKELLKRNRLIKLNKIYSYENK